MSNRLNFTIKQGATFRRTLVFKEADGLLMDLTGSTFRGMARISVTDATPLFSFTFTKANQITNRGEVVVEVSPTTSAAVSVTKAKTIFIYDFERVIGDDVFRFLEGKITFSAEVTK